MREDVEINALKRWLRGPRVAIADLFQRDGLAKRKSGELAMLGIRGFKLLRSWCSASSAGLTKRNWVRAW